MSPEPGRKGYPYESSGLRKKNIIMAINYMAQHKDPKE